MQVYSVYIIMSIYIYILYTYLSKRYRIIKRIDTNVNKIAIVVVWLMKNQINTTNNNEHARRFNSNNSE